MTYALFYSFCFIWSLGFLYTLGRLMVDVVPNWTMALSIIAWPLLLGALMESKT